MRIRSLSLRAFAAAAAWFALAASAALAQDPYDAWTKATGQEKFRLASQLVSTYPGSETAEAVAAKTFAEPPDPDSERMYLFAQAYLEACDASPATCAHLGTAIARLGGTGGSVTPAKLSGMPDSGAFDVYFNNEKIGRQSFSLAASGAYESTYSGKFMGPIGPTVMAVTNKIDVDPNGYWTSANFTTGPFKFIMTRDGAKVNLKDVQGETQRCYIRQNTILHDPATTPALLALVARGYDRARGGVQSFPTISPRWLKTMPMQVRFKDSRIVTVGGQSQSFTRFELPGFGVEPATFWVDAAGKVVAAKMPALEFVRPGYEALR